MGILKDATEGLSGEWRTVYFWFYVGLKISEGNRLYFTARTPEELPPESSRD